MQLAQRGAVLACDQFRRLSSAKVRFNLGNVVQTHRLGNVQLRAWVISLEIPYETIRQRHRHSLSDLRIFNEGAHKLAPQPLGSIKVGNHGALWQFVPKHLMRCALYTPMRLPTLANADQSSVSPRKLSQVNLRPRN